MSNTESNPAHIYHILIKESHLDTFGHVNNATYLEIFEEARWDWITKNDYGLEKIRTTGLGPVVLELSLSFRREITLRKEITIKTFVLDYKGKISKIRQEMIDSDGNLCCQAFFTFGLFDTKRRRLVSPTDDWLKALGRGPQVI